MVFIAKKHFDTDSLIKQINSYNPDFDEERFKEAMDFAVKAHKGQLRKDEKTPYVVHPLKTVEILTDLHAPEDILIAALLHDVPEDTKHTIKEIDEMFGEKVAFLVEGITKLSKVQYQHNMPERQVESLKKMLLHSAKDPSTILIKLADRLHNMQTLQHVNPNKRLRIAGETLEIYVPIANLLGIQKFKCQLQDLCFKYLFPPEYDNLKKELVKKNRKNLPKLKKFKDELNESFKSAGISADVSERKQNLYTIYKKLCANNKKITDVEGRVSLRIVVDNVPECYEALGIVHSVFVPKIGKFKDYIANPKINEYQSLHTTVFADNSAGFVQIMTKKMHLDAMYGIASNFFLDKKSKKEISADIRSSWVNKIVELEKKIKPSGNFLEELKSDIFQDRIYVFTPKGGKIDLPSGACAIDFAYAIHSEIGKHGVKAEINSEIMPITHVLKNGDVLNIITDKSSYPSLIWLPFVKTNLARTSIQKSLKRLDKKKKIKEGCKILQKDLDLSQLGLYNNINFNKIKRRLSDKFKTKLEKFNDLLTAIGEGEINAMDIVKIVREDKKRDISGEKIIVRVLAKNRFGLLRDISSIFYKYSLDMISLKAWASHKLKDAVFFVKIKVKDIESLSNIFDELEQIEDVKEIYRIPYAKLYFFYALAFFTGLIWILHPFVLKAATYSGLIEMGGTISEVVSYFSVLSLLFMVFIMASLIKNHIPYARNKKLLWAFVFGIPILSFLILFVELKFLDMQRSWVPVIIELVIIYFYLVKTYWELRRYT